MANSPGTRLLHVKIFGRRRSTELAQVEAGPSFGVDVDSGVLYGTPTLDDFIFRTGRISRAEALRVPAVKRARDLICGAIGQFPIVVLDPAGRPAETFSPNLFQQPEAGIAPSVTWTHVVEDMLLFGRGWFKTTVLGWHGRPVQGHRLDAESVTVQPEWKYFPEGAVQVWPHREGLIRFDSPNGALLDCSPAIKACVALERIALLYSDGAPPVDYFTAADASIDPFKDDDEAVEFLDSWSAARKKRKTAYVPRGLKYETSGFDPDKLQLNEAREFAITEVARLTGIDAEELSVSTTSRTYFNGQDRRRQRIEDVLGPYMTAIEQRCSMEDVTPRGFPAAFDTSSYLRLDDLSAAQSDSVLIAAKVLLPEEARAKRNLEPLKDSEKPAEPSTQEIAAAHSLVAAIESTRTAAKGAIQ